MSNPNPFVPQGSLLEQQSRRRSRLKLAVFCIVGLGACGLVAMLIQGCKRDSGLDIAPPPETVEATNPPVIDYGYTNPPIVENTNPPMTVPPTIANTNPPTTIVVPPTIPDNTAPPLPPTLPNVTSAAGGTEYTVVKGDTLGGIAKAHGISLKALENANQGVNPRKLIPGRTKLVIPAAGATSSPSTGASSSTDNGGDIIYTIKPGDSLYKISRKYGVSVKAIMRENHLATKSKIYAGKKLKIPTKAETTTPPPAPDASVVPPVPAIPAMPEPAAPGNN